MEQRLLHVDWRASTSPRASSWSTATPSTRSASSARCSTTAAPDVLLAVDDVKTLADEEMKVSLDDDGHLDAHHQADGPGEAAGEYIGATLLEPAAAGPLADALKATWERDPDLYYEDGYQELRQPRRPDRGRADRRRRLGRGRQPRRPGEGAPDRQGILMPLLTRMLPAPLSIDVRRGAIAHLGELLADRRIATEGRVAIVVGPGSGRPDRRARTPEPARPARSSTSRAARSTRPWSSAPGCAAGSYEAVVGIGGGRTIDVDEVRRDARRRADGLGRHEPVPRRHLLADRVAGARAGQGVLRRHDAARR